MEFTLAMNAGHATVDDHVSCTLASSVDTFLERHETEARALSTTSRDAVVQAITSGQRVPVNAVQQQEITAFFMSVNMKLAKEEMDTMRVCGAARFIPGRGDHD